MLITTPVSEVGFSKSSGIMDAFGRVRTSEPLTLSDFKMEYNLPYIYETHLTGAGTFTHQAGKGYGTLTVGTAQGDKVIRQQHQYNVYQPGKSQRIELTGNFPTKSNVRNRGGYFDDIDGIFFENSGGAMSFVVRSSVSGVVVENRVPQSSWNVDKLDGTGPSSITLNPNDSQIVHIEFQYLGVGTVSVGFVIDKKVIICHDFHHANVIDGVPYMRSGNLPVRYEIENIGVSASQTDMNQVCHVVISEGGFEENRGLPFSASTGATERAVTTTESVVIAVRPKLTYNGVANHADIDFSDFEITVNSGNTIYFEIRYGGTVSGGSWVAGGTNSMVEVNTTATGFSGGDTIACGYVTAGGSTKGHEIKRILQKLHMTIDKNNVQDNVFVIARTITSNAGVLAHIQMSGIV